jgi:hypothetical protein
MDEEKFHGGVGLKVGRERGAVCGSRGSVRLFFRRIFLEPQNQSAFRFCFLAINTEQQFGSLLLGFLVWINDSNGYLRLRESPVVLSTPIDISRPLFRHSYSQYHSLLFFACQPTP